MQGTRIFSKFCLLALWACHLSACDYFNQSKKIQNDRAASQNAHHLLAPKPAGNGLLDGSDDMSKALDPIRNMTECQDAAPSTIPSRYIRLTPMQLYQSMSFHSGVNLSADDFKESVERTTLFEGNSYTLLGSDSFLQIVEAQAKKIAEQIDPAAILTCPASSLSSDQLCWDKFIDDFASRVLRRPLRDHAAGAALKVIFTQASRSGNPDSALRVLVYAIFQHPMFLYREEIGQGQNGDLDSFELATMLAYSLTDGPPDDVLWTAAISKSLTFASLESEIRRILGEGDHLKKLTERFFSPYLSVQEKGAVDKSYLTPELVEGSRSDYLSLLHSSSLGGLFHQPLADSRRIGVQNHPYFLMNISRSAEHVSPIFSGITVRHHFLCQDIAPPPQNILESGDAATSIQARQANASCHACHQYIDPVGQNYLTYDGKGEILDQVTVVTSQIVATLDFDGTYANMQDFSQALGNSDHMQRCMALQFYRFIQSRPEQMGESCHISELYKTLSDENVTFKDLLVKALTYPGNAKRR